MTIKPGNFIHPLADEALSLPMRPQLQEAEVRQIVKLFNVAGVALILGGVENESNN